MRAASLAIALTLAACTAPGDSELSAPSSGACEGVSRAALDAVDRKIVGVAAPYAADGSLRARDAELAASQRTRREVAWATVAKVLAPVPLAESVPTEIPAWQTWYDVDDLRRVFHRLYGDLSTTDKEQRARLTDEALDAAFLWNTSAVEELATWPVERYLAHLEAIDEESEVAGLGGISRVRYSPAAAGHLLRSYPEILGCRDAGSPPPRDEGPLVETPVMRTAVTANSCEHVTVGTHAVGEDETLTVVLEDGVDARLLVRAGDVTCEAESICEVHGPAEVSVSVAAGATPLRSAVSITRRSTRPAWAACLDGAFPLDAVVVKADYRRADFEMGVPTYDTSAVGLAERMGGSLSWDEADGEADPPPSEIYSLTLPNGARYRLTALHVMTKELDHWLWTTLWWSPSPDQDFGADRPAFFEGPWASYKMCVASAFTEEDPLPDGGFGADHPSLAHALEAVYGGASWCSNPYLERGHGNASTNCIGCHQHGGTDRISEEILDLEDFGRPRIRNNFPADYGWATKAGDDLEQVFADEELYHLGPP